MLLYGYAPRFICVLLFNCNRNMLILQCNKVLIINQLAGNLALPRWEVV